MLARHVWVHAWLTLFATQGASQSSTYDGEQSCSSTRHGLWIFQVPDIGYKYCQNWSFLPVKHCFGSFFAKRWKWKEGIPTFMLFEVLVLKPFSVGRLSLQRTRTRISGRATAPKGEKKGNMFKSARLALPRFGSAGWWFKSCFWSNLNGMNAATGLRRGTGIQWGRLRASATTLSIRRVAWELNHSKESIQN